MKMYVYLAVVVIVWVLTFVWVLASAHASQCIGAVVNGQCVGMVLPDYTQPFQPRPPDFFTPEGYGVPSSPYPGPAWDGLRFENRTKPVFPGGQLRWVDPRRMK